MWTHLILLLTVLGVYAPLFASPIPLLFPSDSAQVRWLPLENKQFPNLQPEQVATQYLKEYAKELNISPEIQETTFTRRVHQVNAAYGAATARSAIGTHGDTLYIYTHTGTRECTPLYARGRELARNSAIAIYTALLRIYG